MITIDIESFTCFLGHDRETHKHRHLRRILVQIYAQWLLYEQIIENILLMLITVKQKLELKYD